MDVERAAVAEQVVAGAGQFVRHRLQRHQSRLLRRIALIPAPDGRFEADREVGCLHPGPGQVPVAALAVAGAFLLAI